MLECMRMYEKVLKKNSKDQNIFQNAKLYLFGVLGVGHFGERIDNSFLHDEIYVYRFIERSFPVLLKGGNSHLSINWFD